MWTRPTGDPFWGALAGRAHFLVTPVSSESVGKWDLYSSEYLCSSNFTLAFSYAYALRALACAPSRSGRRPWTRRALRLGSGCSVTSGVASEL